MQPIYEAQNLYKCYGKAEALHDVNFAVEPGKLVGLLGPNGSGKTTLLKLSARLLVPSSGRVRIAGQCPGVATKALTAYLPDRLALPSDRKCRDLFAMYRDFFADFDEAKAREMAADLKLEENQRLGAMSKGTQEKLQLCLLMARAARLYLLDEPLGGVDPAARAYILRTILRSYSEDAALVLSTHLVADIEAALDEVLILKQGTVLTHCAVDALREEHGMSVDAYFKEVFAC